MNHLVQYSPAYMTVEFILMYEKRLTESLSADARDFVESTLLRLYKSVNL